MLIEVGRRVHCGWHHSLGIVVPFPGQVGLGVGGRVTEEGPGSEPVWSGGWGNSVSL